MDKKRLPIDHIDQVCVVTPDLRRSMERHRTMLGLAPWRILPFGPNTVRELNYRGKPAQYRVLAAFAQLGGLQYELIQPLQGPSIYHEFLDHHGGEGLHHFGVRVPNLNEALTEAWSAGFEEIQGGRGIGIDGDGGFAYLDTEDPLGITYELIEVPRRMRASSEVDP